MQERALEVWWGVALLVCTAGVQMGWDMVRGLREEDECVAINFRVFDTGLLGEEAPLIAVGHMCGESARRTRLMVLKQPAAKIWSPVSLQPPLGKGTTPCAGGSHTSAPDPR